MSWKAESPRMCPPSGSVCCRYRSERSLVPSGLFFQTRESCAEPGHPALMSMSLPLLLTTAMRLTRHRLGCFCTHHSLGGRIRPPLLSRKRMDVERWTRRHSKDLDETLPNHFRKFKIEVTYQVKVRSKVKIGCFQVADRSDLKRSVFRPKLYICTPLRDQAKVLTNEIVSYLAQVKVKVRSEKVTKPKIFK